MLCFYPQAQAMFWMTQHVGLTPNVDLRSKPTVGGFPSVSSAHHCDE